MRKRHRVRQGIRDSRGNGDIFGKCAHATKFGRGNAGDDFAVIAQILLALGDSRSTCRKKEDGGVKRDAVSQAAENQSPRRQQPRRFLRIHGP